MKKKCVKVSGLIVIFLFLSSPLISSTSIQIKQEQPVEKKDLDKFSTFETDPKIFEIIEKINESILYEFLEELVVNIGPRKTGTYGCEKAGEYIFEQFENMGLETRYHEWESWTPRHKRYYRSKNVEATLPGKGELSNEIIVIGFILCVI